jgi:hypothetical protein
LRRHKLPARVSPPQLRHHQSLNQTTRAAFDFASRIKLDLEALREGIKRAVWAEQVARYVDHAVAEQALNVIRHGVGKSSGIWLLCIPRICGRALQERIRSVVSCSPSLASGSRVDAKGTESGGVDGSVPHDLNGPPGSSTVVNKEPRLHVRGNEVPDSNAGDDVVVAITHWLEGKVMMMMTMVMVMMMVNVVFLFIFFPIVVLLIFIAFLIELSFTILLFFKIRLVELGETEQARQHRKNVVKRVVGIEVQVILSN